MLGPPELMVTEESSLTVTGPVGFGGFTPGAGTVVALRSTSLVNSSLAEVGWPMFNPPVYAVRIRALKLTWVTPSGVEIDRGERDVEGAVGVLHHAVEGGPARSEPGTGRAICIADRRGTGGVVRHVVEGTEPFGRWSTMTMSDASAYSLVLNGEGVAGDPRLAGSCPA